MTPRQKKIALVAAVGLGLVLLPPAAFEALYRIGLWKLPALPSLDVPPAPPLIRQALLASLEPHAERPVQPLWLGNYTRMKGPIENWPVGSAASLALTYPFVWKHHVPDGDLAHALERATVLTWFTRHANAQQLGDLLVAEGNFGRGSRDVNDAARAFFGKPAESLTVAEAALLAAQRMAPFNRNEPACSMKRAEAARNLLLARMRANGFITAAQRAQAVAEPIVTVPHAVRCR